MEFNIIFGIATAPMFVGIKKLFTDLSTWLLVILPVATAVYCLIEYLLMGTRDEADQKASNKRIKFFIKCCVIGMSLSALITLLLTYTK